MWFVIKRENVSTFSRILEDYPKPNAIKDLLIEPQDSIIQQL